MNSNILFNFFKAIELLVFYYLSLFFCFFPMYCDVHHCNKKKSLPHEKYKTI